MPIAMTWSMCLKQGKNISTLFPYFNHFMLIHHLFVQVFISCFHTLSQFKVEASKVD